MRTELPNKNGDTIAQAVPETSAQRLQKFLTNMQWDEEDLNRQRLGKMLAEATDGDGVVFDDTGFPKQGSASVGVARQDSGTLGKVGDCQVAVRLYLPQTWVQDSARRSRSSQHVKPPAW